MKKNGESEVLRCSFCNKDQNDVRKLIAGPTVFICDECVDVCNDIIADDRRVEGRAYKSSLPVPHEIKKFLDEIARREGIEALESDVDAEIARLAERLRKPKETLRRQMEKEGDLTALRARIREDKTLDLLRANARLDTE